MSCIDKTTSQTFNNYVTNTNKKPKIPMLKISDTKDLMTDPDLLLDYIGRHDQEVNKRYRKLWDAYACNPEILRGLLPAREPWKPNFKIPANYAHYIVDTYEGFANGIPDKTLSGDTETADYVAIVSNNNDLDDVFAEIHRNMAIFGEGYQIVYVDDDGEIGTVAVDPLDGFPVYNMSIRPRVRYGVRVYADEDGNRHGTISDEQTVKYFDILPDGLKFREEYTHGFGDTPFIVYPMNNARIGLVEIVYNLCNVVDIILSEKTNDVNAFSDVILKVLGALIDSDQLEDLKSRKIINIPGKTAADVTVEFMDKPTGDTIQEHLLEHVIYLIHAVSGVVNISDESFATSSGIAMKMKMAPMSNIAAGEWRITKACLKRFWRLVFGNVINDGQNYDADSLQFIHTLNYPDNISDAADVAVKLNGVISHKTQLSILPGSIVPDVDAELEQIKIEENVNKSETVGGENGTEAEEI